MKFNIFAELLMAIDGWFSNKCTIIWKKKDMSKNRFLIQLQVSTIKGLGLPTPQASDYVSTVRDNDYSLRHIEHNSGWAKMLPTPIAGDWKGQRRKDGTANMLSGKASLGLLPTPTAYDWNTPRKPETFKAAQLKHKEKGVNLQNPLKQMAVMGMLPTPTAGIVNGSEMRADGTARGLGAMAKLGMLPTPTATDWKGAYPPSSIDKFPARRNMMRNAYQYENKEYNSKTSQLNPLFVEEMMGFPDNWTLNPFLNKK